MKTAQKRAKEEFGKSNMVRTVDVYPALSKLSYEMVKIRRIIRKAKSKKISQQSINNLINREAEYNNEFDKIIDALVLLENYNCCKKGLLTF